MFFVFQVLYALCNAAFRRTYLRILTCRWGTRSGARSQNRYYYGWRRYIKWHRYRHQGPKLVSTGEDEKNRDSETRDQTTELCRVSILTLKESWLIFIGSFQQCIRILEFKLKMMQKWYCVCNPICIHKQAKRIPINDSCFWGIVTALGQTYSEVHINFYYEVRDTTCAVIQSNPGSGTHTTSWKKDLLRSSW